MSVADIPNTSLTPPAAPHPAGQTTTVRGRGCKVGRGLPLQQRKVYRNLARQTPRVQGLTFDHNQIRWISYWKNEQNKQVQKHFPVSRYGFLGARRLALEERNRIMGKPPDADEAAEAIANLKIDPSIPYFLEWNSPGQSDDIQAVEVEDEATCTSAETWQDEEGDSPTEAHRSEMSEGAAAPQQALVSVPPLLPAEISGGQMQLMEVEATAAAHSSAMSSAAVECQSTTPKCPSAGSANSSDFLHSNGHLVGASKGQEDSSVVSRGVDKRPATATATEVFPRSCDMDEANDEFLASTMTRTTTAAPDSCNDRHFMASDRTTSSTSACFDEADMQQETGAIALQGENKSTSANPPVTEPFKRPVPPALPAHAMAWEEEVSSYEHISNVS